MSQSIGYSNQSDVPATAVARSKRTFEAISHLLGNEFDTQAAMLCRPLFEDMLVAHWLDYNRHDSEWLVERFFRHRDAIALDQLEIFERHGWTTGPVVVPNPDGLRRQQNELVGEFKARARRDWWDPGSEGRGRGAPIGIEGVAGILEDVAARHERFQPRFAGGDEPLLRPMETIIVKWFSRQLHHTAIGLPFQPHATGPIELAADQSSAWRVLFTSYWTYGQQGYLILEHLGQEVRAFNQTFLDGLYLIGSKGLLAIWRE